MDKNKFLNLLQGSEPLSKEYIEDVKLLIKEHPYFQIPYFLLARENYLTNNSEKDSSIQIASAYAAERRILKKFITAGDKKQESESKDQHLADKENESIKISAETLAIEEQHVESESIISPEQKNNIVISQASLPPQENRIEVPFIEKNEAITTESPEEVKPTEIVTDTTEVETKEDVSKATSDKAEEIDDSFILGYLNNLKADKDEAPNYRRKHQDNIIERFIKLTPSLNRPDKAKAENHTDLSEPSITLDNNLVSENLAVIMVKQGKVEKAIDIYKKLIWKYPQKKAYFANRIQELKK